MHSLKITFTFGSPVVVDSEYPLHLDALLAWCRVQEAIEQGIAEPWPLGDDLPLEKAGTGKDWVWKASRLLFTAEAPRQLVNMQRKSSPEQFYADFDDGLWSNDKAGKVFKEGQKPKKPPVVNTQSGQFRAYQFYVSTQWMKKAEAWCIGDPVRVKELLHRLESIGKMGRNGFGTVASVEVEVVPDQEQWRIRVLPEDVEGLSGVNYAPVTSAPRAPYWDKLKCVPMFEPIV